METFQENKIFGDVFCHHLKDNFGFSYTTVDPKLVSMPDDYPDIDVVLVSERDKPLYLQLKQSIEFEKLIKMMTKSILKIFKNRPFETTIKEYEDKYITQGKSIKDIILILHSHIGYLMPWDADVIGEIKSNFRGIYAVSPELNDVWQEGKKKNLKEFVSEIKSAFS